MGNKIYVGNLSWGIDSEGLKKAFSAFGDITDAVVIKDKYSGRSKGFGFVTFADEDSAAKAVAEMNEKDLDGRNVKVSEAQEMRPRE